MFSESLFLLFVGLVFGCVCLFCATAFEFYGVFVFSQVLLVFPKVFCFPCVFVVFL